MPACSTCGGTEDVHLYERRDVRDAPRSWSCLDCVYFAARLQGVRVEAVPRWVERAALHGLPLKPVDDPLDRRVSFGRRATDRVLG